MARYPGEATVRYPAWRSWVSPGVAIVRYDRWRTVLGGEVAVP